MKFIAEIDSDLDGIEEFRNVTMNKRLESESPSALLEALRFTNVTRNPIPTLEALLFHLFEKKAAYAGANYTIYVSYK